MGIFSFRSKQEKRRSPRYGVEQFLVVYQDDLLIGHIKDLSITGMCVATEMALPLNNVARLVIEMTMPEGDTKRLPISCRTQSIRPAPQGINLVGFQFMSMSAGTTRRLQHLISCQQTLLAQQKP